jgi:hypothetical protein
METSQNKKNRLAEIVIVIMLLVCVALILTDLTINLVNELDTGEKEPVVMETTVVETTVTPTPAARPTFPPDYTPEAIIDS